MAGLGESILGFSLYFAAAVALTVVFLAIYVKSTPHNELQLMRDGNGPAALGLVGALIGFVLPLSLVISVSYEILHVLIWGAVALVVQVAGQFGARLVLPRLSADIADGKWSAAIVQAGIALALGVLQAACWTP